MKSYTRYIQLLQNFQFRLINPLQKPTAGNNYRFGDVEELDSLKKFIIAELEVAAPGNVRLILKKLRELNMHFVYFDKNYPEFYKKTRDGLLEINELKKYLPFRFNNDWPTMSVTPELLKTLYVSILFRQKSLLNLINQTEDLLAGITEESIKPA